ncbi:hypothetical protein BLA29_005529 [Euroglyphus maynei]|uniref:Uncharacterized protein n=1 Tax=Euroglyphus maynei TaxID=6958 RepID=A0A1Y3BIK4_EURMA|nr:hypothetical protein BLA29_005529 [Euroglyphus maynei]
MILSKFYSTQFYRFLALQQYVRPLKTNTDLIDAIESGTHETITLQHSIVLDYYHDNDDSFSAIFENIEKNAAENVPILEQGFDKLENDSRYVLLESKTAFKYLIKNYAQKAMLISDDNMGNDYLAIAFSKHSPLFHSFNHLYVYLPIRIFIRNGFIQYWINEVIQSQHTANHDEYSLSLIGIPKTTIDTDGLDMDAIKSIFIVLSIGLIISYLTLIFEIGNKFIYKRIKNSKKGKRRKMRREKAKTKLTKLKT